MNKFNLSMSKTLKKNAVRLVLLALAICMADAAYANDTITWRNHTSRPYSLSLIPRNTRCVSTPGRSSFTVDPWSEVQLELTVDRACAQNGTIQAAWTLTTTTYAGREAQGKVTYWNSKGTPSNSDNDWKMELVIDKQTLWLNGVRIAATCNDGACVGTTISSKLDGNKSEIGVGDAKLQTLTILDKYVAGMQHIRR
jgi:hypothetical protein